MTNKSELLTIENIAEGFRNLDFTPSEILDTFLTNIEQLTEINAFIEVYQNEAKAKAQ
jgi:Asp-tRNA(Asn)/Glu-tRNA(Gln) amidotransferase A subunit family amidase